MSDVITLGVSVVALMVACFTFGWNVGRSYGRRERDDEPA